MIFRLPSGIVLLAFSRLVYSQIVNNGGQVITQGSYTPNIGVPCPPNLARRTNDDQFVLDPREVEYTAGRRALHPTA